MNPSGGLRTLELAGRHSRNASRSSFTEDLREDEKTELFRSEDFRELVGAGAGNDDPERSFRLALDKSLLQPGHGGLSRSRGSSPAARHRSGLPINRAKLGNRARLVFRIISMIAAGTTLACVADVCFNYIKTHLLHTGDGKDVWPANMDLSPTVAILVASGFVFVVDFFYFIASAKVSIRTLETRKHKLIAAGFAVMSIAFLSVGVIYSEVIRLQNRPGRSNLFWVCKAKDKSWDDSVTVDWEFLCGEIFTSEYTRYITLGAQVLIIVTVLYDSCCKGRRKNPQYLKVRGRQRWSKVTTLFSRDSD